MITNAQLNLITSETSIFWFRRDLRLSDNAGLYHALKKERSVIPVFIFDTCILNKLEDKKDSRVDFIHRCLSELKNELEKLGSSLLVLQGDPVEIYTQVSRRPFTAITTMNPTQSSVTNRLRIICKAEESDFIRSRIK